MPAIAFIVARSFPEHVIGCENRLPWKLHTDMQFFKSVTTDHAVVMGRNTYDSIGRPLPNRMNIVLSKQDGNASNNLIWVQDFESSLFFADYYTILKEKPQFIVIGGEKIYKLFEGFVNKIYLTEVFGSFPNGDAYFDKLFDMRQWGISEERDYPSSELDEYPFRITVLEKKIKTIRQRNISDFMVNDVATAAWRDSRFEQKAKGFERLPEEQFPLPELTSESRSSLSSHNSDAAGR